jgi:hypothetical protein
MLRIVEAVVKDVADLFVNAKNVKIDFVYVVALLPYSLVEVTSFVAIAMVVMMVVDVLEH